MSDYDFITYNHCGELVCPECGHNFLFDTYKDGSASEARSALYNHLLYVHDFSHDEAFELAGQA
ncbi:hypothetical protein EGM51_03715 [Verrucomicrobia bacterium S94]|nr:hypothetical protein EGM51_03715 [Verrucomicrobia bacterium S94]